MKVYDFQLSGNAYKVRLFLNLIGQPYQRVPVDLATGEQKTAAFLAKNPAGKVPVLEDHGQIIPDSHAILVYLAKTNETANRERWLPDDPVQQARVIKWLGVVSDDINNGLSATRLIKLFNAPLDYAAAADRAHRLLKRLDDHLERHQWLAAEAPTIADIAMFPYVRLAQDGAIALDDYPSVNAWLLRVERLPGFVAIDE